MTSHDKLLTNTTNRISLQEHEGQSYIACSNSNHILMPTPIHRLKELPFFAKRQQFLMKQIQEAKEEQKVMLELFQQIGSLERGESKPTKKLQRRCNKDIVQRSACPYPGCNKLYSTQDTLNRHIRLKHKVVKNERMKLFRDLEPWPNLSDESDRNEPPDKQQQQQESDMKKEIPQ